MPNHYSIPVQAAIESARPLFFENENDVEFPISIGATCFIVAFKGGVFAVTAEHALTGEQRRDLHETKIAVASDSLDWLPLRMSTDSHAATN